MGYGKHLMDVGKGSLAIAGSDLIVFKALPMLPATLPGVSFIQGNPMAVRLLMAGACLFGADKFKKFEMPLLIAASHNLNAGIYTVQKVHDFIGIHRGQIDQIASDAVSAIEQSISDEIEKFKQSLNDETVNGNPLSEETVSEPLSNPLSDDERMGEEISYELIME